MEGIGEKFRQARMARNLTIEEAARMTKIRPSKLTEIEAENFSHFPNLAYAKGFLLIYGKFLNVDVTPYLEAFDTSETMTIDGYSYLQDNPALKPRRAEIARARAPSNGKKSSLLPLVIGVIVIFAGFSLLRLLLDIKRIKPTTERDAAAPTVATATPVSTPAAIAAGIVAPRALPVDPTPAASPAPADPAMAPTPLPMNSAPPAPPPTAAPIAVAPESQAEPEIRRAEPVHAEDLAKAQAALASPTPRPAANRFDIRPLRKTYLRVTVDNGAGGKSMERWINGAEAPLQFSGKQIAVKVLDPSAVEIRKNGRIVGPGDADVRIE